MAIHGWKSRRFTTGGPCFFSGLRRIGLVRSAALDHLRLHHGGTHLPAYATIPAWRAPGRGADHGGVRGNHRLFPRCVDGHADGRALAIGLLGWYAWYETGSKFWLYDIYFFTGLATLAKGRWHRFWRW